MADSTRRPLICSLPECQALPDDVDACPCYSAAIAEDIETTWSQIDLADDLDELPADSLPWPIDPDASPLDDPRPTRVHSSGECSRPFPHPATAECLDPTRILSSSTAECIESWDASGEPWSDEDTDELAEAMTEAAHLRRDAYARLRATARRAHRDAVAAATPSAGSILLRVRAAEYGIVPSPDLPDNVTRQRELISAPLDERRIASSTYQAAHDRFELRTAFRDGGPAWSWPIVATGIAAATRPAMDSTLFAHRIALRPAPYAD